MKDLKETNPTLYQINEFILKAKELEYGEMEFTVKIHNYNARIIDMKAVKPKKKTMPKSVTKRVMIKKNENKKVV